MPQVVCQKTEVQMQRGCTNYQVGKTDGNPLLLLLTMDSAGNSSDIQRQRMNGNGKKCLFDKRLATLPVCVSPGSIDSMNQFCRADSR